MIVVAGATGGVVTATVGVSVVVVAEAVGMIVGIFLLVDVAEAVRMIVGIIAVGVVGGGDLCCGCGLVVVAAVVGYWWLP